MYRLTKNLPIGVYDSGIGGLSVLKMLCDNFPNEKFVYFGDNGNAPYGNKSIEEVKNLSSLAVTKLKRKRVKAIVIACNTISTRLYKYIKDISGIPIIKTLPPESEDKRACLLCTPLTADSARVKSCFQGKVLPCDKLAWDIEKNVFSLNKINLKNIIKNIPDNTSEIILGCTHYYYIKEKIEGLTGIKTLVCYENVINALRLQLKSLSLCNEKGKQKITFIGKFRKKNEKVYKEVLKKTPEWSKNKKNFKKM